MRIGILCYPTYGGSGVIATELGKALANRGHVVHFITYNRPVRLGGFQENIYYHRVDPPPYPLFDFLPYETALVSQLVEVGLYHELDLLHVHYAIPHASSALMAQQILAEQGKQLPFITTLHGTDITLVGQEASYKPVVTHSLNHSPGITTVSDFLRGATYEQFSLKRPIEDIHVVPNFIDTKRFRQRDRSELSCRVCPPGERVLLHASNFRDVKRVPDVLAAFRDLQEELPARLLFVGDGPLRSPVERQAREWGLDRKVIFLGVQDSIEDILPMADVFVMPSESESFGLAALEAMACGVPVVASDTGGLPELVLHGQCGLLHPVGDIPQMVQHLQHILQDTDTQRTFAQNAWSRAQQFDIDKVVPQYEQCYQNVLAVQAAAP